MTEEKPDDWCECYGCTTMRHPCISEVQQQQDRDYLDVAMTRGK